LAPLIARLEAFEAYREEDANLIANLTIDVEEAVAASAEDAAKVLRLTGDVAVLRNDAAMLKRGLYITNNTSKALKAQVSTLESGRPMQQNDPSDGGLSVKVLQDLADRFRPVEIAVLEPEGTFGQIRLDVAALGEKIDMGGVEFGDRRFGSPKELFAWIKKRHPVGTPDYGLFWDGFSKLHALDPGTRTMSELLKDEHDTQKVKYRSELAARVSTSYKTNVPDVFGKPVSKAKAFGPAMATALGWHDRDAGTGLKVVIKDGIDDSFVAIKGAIETGLENRELRDLALDMLNDTKQFVLDLVRFVDDYFAEVSSASAVTEEDAWVLVSSMLAEIISEMRIARNLVKHSRVNNDMYHIWGALKTHVIMKRFSAANFINDSALSGVVVRFLMKRKTDLDGMTGVNRKVTACEGKITTVANDVKALKTDVRKLKEQQ